LLEGGTRLRFAAPVLFCWALSFIAAGCGQPAPVGPSEPLVQLNTTAEFNSTVLDSRKPVIVMFYKEGCPACAKLEVLLGQLAAEYHGRAVFAKYPMATPLGIVKNRELRDKFDVYVWPTAMLFFDEREKKRWLTNDFPADVFRKDLDEILSAGKDSGGRVTK
jgi:thiol-disulfide isomerase/thioredoxin